MSKTVEYNDIIAFHPGVYIKEIIEEYGITQEEFAFRLGSNTQTVSGLINGRNNITNDLALKLERLTKVSRETWLNLQEDYNLKVIEIKNAETLDEEISILKQIDYSYFVKHFNLPSLSRKLPEKVAELRSFLFISNLNILKDSKCFISFRNTSGEFDEKGIINSNIMVELATQKANKIDTNKFDLTKLINSIDEIRNMTTMECEEFLPKLINLFKECGIAFVVLPSLKNSRINGAVKKIGRDKVLLLVNDRNKDSDIFWFSLFHELGHIINGDYEINLMGNTSETEVNADNYAREKLIDSNNFNEFVEKKDFSINSVISFAQNQNIQPGIVVGRLQNEDHINYATNLNSLKKQYSICISHIE